MTQPAKYILINADGYAVNSVLWDGDETKWSPPTGLSAVLESSFSFDEIPQPVPITQPELDDIASQAAAVKALVDVKPVSSATYILLASDISKLRTFTHVDGCTIIIPDDLGNDLDDFEIYLYRKGGALDISHSVTVTTEGIDPGNVAEGGTLAVKKLGVNNAYLII